MVYLYVSRPCRSDRQVINGLVITRLHAAKRSVSCSLVNAVQLLLLQHSGLGCVSWVVSR